MCDVLIAEDDAAALELRRAGRPLACSTGPLLPVGLGPTARDKGPVLRAVGSSAALRELSPHLGV